MKDSEQLIDNLKTINEIHSFVQSETNIFLKNEKLLCSAQKISDYLSISRSLSSYYLNILNKDGVLIKIISRPVYFLDKKILEEFYMLKIDKNTYEDVDEFLSYLNDKSKSNNGFKSMVGYKTVLLKGIRQCMMSINYPPIGLPILIIGENGVGKELMAYSTFLYAKNIKIFNEESKFIKFNLKKDNDVKRLIKCITDNTEIINNGLVYIKNFGHDDILTSKIFEYFIQHGYFNDGEYFKKQNLRIVFSCADLNCISPEYLSLFPVQIKIPNYNERSLKDKIDLIAYFMQKESNRTNKDIFISRNALNLLLNYNFEENINDLKKSILSACASDMLCNNDAIRIKTLDLPLEYDDITKINLEDNIDDIHYFSYNDLIKYDKYYNTNEFFEFLKKSNKDYSDGICSIDELFFNLKEKTNSFFDYLIFENKCNDIQLNNIKIIVGRIVENIANKYNIMINTNFILVISKIIYVESLKSNEVSYNDNDIKNIFDIYYKYNNKVCYITELIADEILKHMDISLDYVNKIFISVYMADHIKVNEINDLSCVIISHGYSTASSIVDATNRLLENQLYVAIDMPLNTSVENVVEKLKKYILKYNIRNNLIILVDMGSLENIGNLLNGFHNINIGVINNISTKIALNVGYKILENKKLETILNEICEESSISYTIVKNSIKPKAIIFSAENGYVYTKRMVDLFKNSLPSDISMEFLIKDFSNLDIDISNDDVFKNYDVQLLIGAKNLDIKDVSFISLEDIIASENINLIKSVLSEYLDATEMEVFEENLFSNFSLQNIIGYLTILNPEKLLANVENSIKNLEKSLSTKFIGKTIIGLNVHISCLIERLVTKDVVINSKNNDYSDKEYRFVELFKECFKELEGNYGIEIPIVEILYIRRYIMEDLKYLGDLL